MRKIKKLTRILRKINDPRQAWKIKHSLVEILVICIISITAGANSSHEINIFAANREAWLRKYLRLENGIPSRLTIERVLRLMNPKAMEKAFMSIMRFVQSVSKGNIVAIDGKAYFNTREGKGAAGVCYMVNAWCAANGMCLGQVQTKEKSNEITAIPELLKYLGIKGAIVTIDAIGCQKDIVKQITKENKADYVIALKRNQPTMYHEVMEYAKDCIADELFSDAYTKIITQEKGHGRIEKREYYLFNDVSWFQDHKEWAGLAGFVMVRSTRQIGDQQATHESRFYITTLTSVKEVAVAVRGHWGIENTLHWSLDVVFHEDDWATKKETAAANLSHIRRLTANLLKAETSSNLSGPNKRYQCALNSDYLEQVLFGSMLFS